MNDLPATIQNNLPAVAISRSRADHFLANFQTMQEACALVAKSGLFPGLHSREKVFAVGLYGASVGLDLAQAAQSVYLVNGRPSLSADMMRAIIERDVPGAKITVKTETNTECEIEFSAIGRTNYTSKYTMQDAALAGLSGKDTWKKSPREMLYARALSRGCRRFCPGALAGIYCREEIEDGGLQAASMPMPQSTPSNGMNSDPAKDPMHPANILPSGQKEMIANDGEIIDVPASELPTTSEAANYANGNTDTGGLIIRAPVGEPFNVPASTYVKPINEFQKKEILNLKAACGLADMAEWVSLVSDTVGRSVGSAKELNYEEANRLITCLRRLESTPKSAVPAAAMQAG